MSPDPWTVKVRAGLAEPARQRRVLLLPADPRAVPPAARPRARHADVAEDRGGHGRGGVLRRHRERGGDEQARLHRRGQAGQADGAHPDPARAAGGVVAGERVTGPDQPQPPRCGGRDRARQARSVLGVVVLHPHPVPAGDHDRRVRRPRPLALLDDDPRLGPWLNGARHEVPLRVGAGRDPAVGRDQAGQRRHPDRDAAAARQGPVHEVEAVGDRLAAGPHRVGRLAGDLGADGAVRPGRLAAALRAGSGPQPDARGHRRGDHHGDHPAAHGAELGPFGVQHPPEAVPLHLGAGPLRRHRRGHLAAPNPAAGSLARYSTASRVSSR